MALSDKRILKQMKKGKIVIEPFNRKQLSTSSYDVRLGEYFYREQKPPLEDAIFNIYDAKDVKRVWGEPQKAPLAKDVLHRWPLQYFDENSQVILLKPGETILAHTEEFIGGLKTITSMMKARSSLGRSFILVCKCAGWGDIGYINRWTMEITNVSTHYSVPLLVGSRIAQLILIKAGKIVDKDYGQTGNYQKSTDIKEIMLNWTADSMLPKNKP